MVGGATENTSVEHLLTFKELETKSCSQCQVREDFGVGEGQGPSYESFCFVLFKVSRGSGWLQIYYVAGNDFELMSFWSTSQVLGHIQLGIIIPKLYSAGA